MHFDETVDEEREDWLGDQLDDFNVANSAAMAALEDTPADEEEPLHVYALDGRTVVGGLTGTTWGYWLDIDVLWVDPSYQGTGIGSELLARAERQARSRDCRHVRVETSDFQAPEFYRRHGYQVAGTLVDYPPGVTEYLFTKSLENGGS